MVHLDRISTRTGDAGTTRLSDGSAVAKDTQLIEVIGAVDEANCALGVVLAQSDPGPDAERVQCLQHDLFDLGADIATPPGGPYEDKIPRITAAAITRLDGWLEEATIDLEPLTSFVLPGGSPAAAHMHVARASARRAERALVAAWPAMKRGALSESAPLRYLNRLSDLLFQFARRANDHGRADVLWRPGGKPDAAAQEDD